MATSLWNATKIEVQAVVDDFREKGATGVLRDVALDTADIAASATSWLTDVREHPVLVCDSLPLVGDVCPVLLPDGLEVDAMILDVYMSDMPSARVLCPELEEHAVVQISMRGAAARPADTGGSLLDGIREDFGNRVSEIRAKGVVGTVKDATKDAADFVKTTSASARHSVLSKNGSPVENEQSEGVGQLGLGDVVHGVMDSIHQSDTLQSVKSKAVELGQSLQETLPEAFESAKVVTLSAAATVGNKAAMVGSTAKEVWKTTSAARMEPQGSGFADSVSEMTVQSAFAACGSRSETPCASEGASAASGHGASDVPTAVTWDHETSSASAASVHGLPAASGISLRSRTNKSGEELVD